MSGAKKVVLAGPLTEQVANIEARLAGLGYASSTLQGSTLQGMVRVIAQLSAWLELHRICLPELTRELVEQFVFEQYSGGHCVPGPVL